MGIQEVVEQSWEEIVAIHNAPILAAIDSAISKRDELQEQYDSLLEFKGKVENYQLDFIGASESIKRKLSDLDSNVKNNDAKNLYLKGMADTFKDMVDNRIPPSVFDWFYNMIQTKLETYLNEISDWNDSISYLNTQLW